MRKNRSYNIIDKKKEIGTSDLHTRYVCSLLVVTIKCISQNAITLDHRYFNKIRARHEVSKPRVSSCKISEIDKAQAVYAHKACNHATNVDPAGLFRIDKRDEKTD